MAFETRGEHRAGARGQPGPARGAAGWAIARPRPQRRVCGMSPRRAAFAPEKVSVSVCSLTASGSAPRAHAVGGGHMFWLQPEGPHFVNII